MLFISFAWTTSAFLARAKTCTRRPWPENYAKLFKKGMVVGALDRGFRIGGKQIGTFQLIADPEYQYTNQMPEEDYKKEGLLWMEQQGMKIRNVTP